MNTKTLLPVLLLPATILSIPAGAMWFEVEGWAWGAGDFLVAWVLLTGVGLGYKLATRQAVGRSYRFATGIGLAAGLALVWVNGAVGLIGNENNPANLMYGGVVLVGIVGAVLARLEPLGLSRAAFACAAAQFLVPVVAVVWAPDDFSPGFAPVFALNFGFVLLFAGSGWLFRRAL